ncbi:MAG: diheme cytochrome c-553 [Bacteroidia bacterium]|nr:diheme cytochrome c-553 [Bacteroidia bacterium]
MKKIKFPVWALIITSIALWITSCAEPQKENENNLSEPAATDEIIKYGEYLVGIMGCNDCHSPKAMGPNGPEIISELLLSGFPADRPIISFKDSLVKAGYAQFYPDLTAGAGPWGITFAANLTPDETGIGNWTESQFKVALTQGKYKGQESGRMLLPPMPWQNYKNMKDTDIKAVFMYLKSLKPVSNLVPAPVAPGEM